MPTALIQLARTGDVVNMLPIAKWFADTEGTPPRVYTNRKFADIFEAVSYVDLRIWQGGTIDLASAEKQARLDGADRVVITQSNGNPYPPAYDTGNFLTQPWERAGLLSKFHELPLVFDRRDYAGEAAAVAQHWPQTDGPVVAVCTRGVSSPFDRGEEVKRALRAAGHTLLDLDTIYLPKVHHLLGLIEKSAMLVSIDSLPIHLSYATGTPTVTLSRNHPYYASEPRKHWRGRVYYDERDIGEAVLWAMQGDAGSMMRKEPEPPPPMQFVTSWYTDGNDRYNRARRTWPADVLLLPTGRNMNGLPFVRDLIDAGFATGADTVVIHNCDIAFTDEAQYLLGDYCRRFPACWANRIDVRAGTGPYKTRDLRRRQHVGTDVFAMTRQWWDAKAADWPDMLLGREGWDWVMRRLMRDNGGDRCPHPICWHEAHVGQWKRDMQGDEGQQYNRRLGREWAIAHGYKRDLHPGPYLFK